MGDPPISPPSQPRKSIDGFGLEAAINQVFGERPVWEGERPEPFASRSDGDAFSDA